MHASLTGLETIKMDKESEGLDLLEKHVFEEDKIVTYKWLSRQLNVHVNIAKRLLAKFVDKTSDKLGVTYVIGGVLPDGSHKFVVDWYDNISDTEHEFKTVTSKHVYSVQKNVTNGDLKTVLFINDTCETKAKENNVGCSSIKCEDSIVRNGSAMVELRQKALSAAKNKSAVVKGKKNVPDSNKQTNGLEKNGALKLSDSNSNADSSNVKSASASPKKSGIAAMFAAQKDTKKPENKVQDKPSKPPVKSKGLAAFFNQQNTNKSSEKVNEDKNKKELKNDSPKNGIDTSDSASKENSESTETDIKTKSNDKCNNSKTSNNKSKSKKPDNKRKKSRKDEDSMKKKRKRIVQISDSESSDEEKYERSPSPEQREPTPPPPAIENDDLVHTSENGGKYKKKKLVEKTFLDADGFLVTSKEYEFVSASEDEDEKNKTTDKPKEEIKKPAEAKVKEVKKTSPAKVKQASIMNFFGKK